MSLIADLFGNKGKGESVVLVDVNANSVAGAYAHYIEGKPPVIVYTRRLPIESHANESREAAMLRALQILGETLVREGAPALARATGSGSAREIIVSVDAPWEETSMRTESFEDDHSFLFTRNLVAAKLKETATQAEGKKLVDESIVGSILNGYETRNPYGKEARRASIIILTSSLDEAVAERVITILRGVFHASHVRPIAGSSLRFQAMQKAFPHERDALILDATGPFASIALVRKGIVVSISGVNVSRASTTESWIRHVEGELAELAQHYPLPRTIFLLAREAETAALRETLDAANLGKLWLSDNPPKIVSVFADHIAPLVQHASSAPPDLILLFMAIYYQRL